MCLGISGPRHHLLLKDLSLSLLLCCPPSIAIRNRDKIIQNEIKILTKKFKIIQNEIKIEFWKCREMEPALEAMQKTHGGLKGSPAPERGAGLIFLI